jgi:hypothetical protein
MQSFYDKNKLSQNNGKDFEQLTESIYRNLVSNPQFEKVERNVQLEGKDGKRQVDILVTTVTFGIEVKTIIECKDHSRKISVGAVDALHSVIQDLNGNKGIIVSNSGFSSKAISKAKRLGITLCTAYEAMSPKWSFPSDLPLLLTQIDPVNVVPHIEFICEEASSEEFVKYNHDFNSKFFKIFEKYWESNVSDTKIIAGTQLIDLNSHLNENEFLDQYRKIGTITDFKVELEIKLNYYFGYLNEIEQTKLLCDITDNRSVIIVNRETFLSYLENLKKIELSDVPDINKFCLFFYVKEEFNFRGIDHVELTDASKTNLDRQP